MKLFELEAILTLDATDFDRQISKSKSSASEFAKSIGADADSIKGAFSSAFSFSVGELMADGFRTAINAAWDFTTGSIEAASNLQEVQHVVDTVFSDKAGQFNTWAQGAKEAFGLGEYAAKSYASSIASVLSPETRGFNADEIYEMSTSLTALIGDIASFQNMGFDEVFTMIMSGLRGETESIERLGIDMRISSLAAFAGLEKDTDFSKLSDYEQTMYRYQYIMQATTRMQGDFAETEGSYANQMRLLQENIADLQAEIGNNLLPVLTGLVTGANDLFELFSSETPEESVAGIANEFTSAYAEINTTAASAQALIKTLQELEENGLTEEEQIAWDSLVQRLIRDIPTLADVIGDNTAPIEGGTEALSAHVEAWKTASLELGQQSSLAKYYEELGAQQVVVAEAEAAAMYARNEADYLTDLFNQTWGDAIAYLYEQSGYDPATQEEISNLLSTDASRNTVLQSLQAFAWRGDSGAQGYVDALSDLITPEEAERAAVVAEQKYATEVIELQKLQEALTVLTNAVNALSQNVATMSENPPSVEVTNVLDGEPIASAMTKRLTRNTRNKMLTAATA